MNFHENIPSNYHNNNNNKEYLNEVDKDLES
jgi:hypothetical protein